MSPEAKSMKPPSLSLCLGSLIKEGRGEPQRGRTRLHDPKESLAEGLVISWPWPTAHKVNGQERPSAKREDSLGRRDLLPVNYQGIRSQYILFYYKKEYRNLWEIIFISIYIILYLFHTSFNKKNKYMRLYIHLFYCKRK